jgi:hypothetical protein
VLLLLLLLLLLLFLLLVAVCGILTNNVLSYPFHWKSSLSDDFADEALLCSKVLCTFEKVQSVPEGGA